MIQDPPLWSALRSDPKHNLAFRSLLARFAMLTGAGTDGHSGTASASTSAAPTPKVSASPQQVSSPSSREPFHTDPYVMTAATPTATGGRNAENKKRGRALPEAAIRMLQHTMLFIAPVPKLRYTVPAMSLSWASSCCVDGATQRFVTFGASKPAQVPDHLRFKSCVAGDSYFAALSDNGEVWISGTLDSSGAASGVNGGAGNPQMPETMRGMCGKTLQISGRGGRLFGLTTGLSLRPISSVSAGTRSLIPYRLVQFIDAGLGEDLFMIGVDSTIYKTTASSRSTGTPRRIMTFSRICVSRVASGSGSLAVIDQCGQLYTMGRNKFGQVGTGHKQDSVRRPVLQSAFSAHFFTMVAVGEKHSLALTSTGVVYGCGSNETGQLGLGEAVREVLRFTKIPLPSPCVGIAAGPAGSFFACADGKLYGCGANECQQLGVPYGARVLYIPTAVPGVRSGVMSYVVDAMPSVRAGNGSVVSPGVAPTEATFDDSRSISSNNTVTTMPLAASVPPKTKQAVCAKCCSVS
jgi:hypothetical protein